MGECRYKVEEESGESRRVNFRLPNAEWAWVLLESQRRKCSIGRVIVASVQLARRVVVDAEAKALKGAVAGTGGQG